MGAALTYYDYYDNTGMECPEGAPATEKKLIACDPDGDDLCPCPTAPAVIYLKGSKEVLYFPETNVENIYNAGSITLTNNTAFPVNNVAFLIEGVYIAVIVPGTEVVAESGDTVTYTLYAPRDLQERLCEETDDTDLTEFNIDLGVVFTQSVQPANIPTVTMGGEEYGGTTKMAYHNDDPYTILDIGMGEFNAENLCSMITNEGTVGDIDIELQPNISA